MFYVFYSWQSDLHGAANRYLIGDALEKACREITNKKGIGVDAVLDRDTLGKSGAPDIRDAILAKIDNADAYVADVTTVNAGTGEKRLTPNPNVLFEAGYARARLGSDALIYVFNTYYGKPEDLPFDLRGVRLLSYYADPEANDRATVRKTLSGDLRGAIEAVGRVKRNDPVMEIAFPGTKEVAGRAPGIISILITGAKKTYDPKTITEQELCEVCNALTLHGTAPVSMLNSQNQLVQGTWLHLLYEWRRLSRDSMQKVLVFGAALDPRHVALLVAIEHSSYFAQIDLMNSIGTGAQNTTLSFLAPCMWKYVLAARCLDDYADTVLARRAADL